MKTKKVFDRKFIKNQLSQIIALTERNIKLNLRFKYKIIISFVTPIIMIAMPIIILGRFLDFNTEFGPWNANNFLIFQFAAYQIYLIRNLINEFPAQLLREKYWKTIPALIIAPLNRFNILIGIFISHMILISPPIILFLIISYIAYPISFLTLIFVIIILFSIALIFSSIGLFLGVFAISNENIWRIIAFGINIVFWFSCLTYPFELFPNVIQQFINLNPLYYIFDILRVAWIEDSIILSIYAHPLNFIVLILCVILLPSISVYFFNFIYKKIGIVGY